MFRCGLAGTAIWLRGSSTIRVAREVNKFMLQPRQARLKINACDDGNV
jgi:hypothetical protein